MTLVSAHHETARLAAEIHEQGWITHRRQVEREPRRPCDEILMRHWNDGDVHAREVTDLGREHPARVDDDLRLDLAFVRLDADDAPAVDGHGGRPRLRRDLRAAATRAFCERKCQLA